MTHDTTQCDESIKECYWWLLMWNVCLITGRSSQWQQEITQLLGKINIWQHSGETSEEDETPPHPRGQRVKVNHKEALNHVSVRRAHQEDDVGVLVESSGHADSLSLTAAQVDALEHRNTAPTQLTHLLCTTFRKGRFMETMVNSRRTLSPISVWSPKGSRSMSSCREQASMTALYLDNTNTAVTDELKDRSVISAS